MFTFSRLKVEEIDDSYIKLLSLVGKNDNYDLSLIKNTYMNMIENNPSTEIWVIKDNNKIVATGTLLIEQKLYRNCKNVGHIEDICVTSDHQGKGIGKMMIDHLIDIGKQKNCYKIILDCGENVKQFYERCGMESKNIQMSMYF